MKISLDTNILLDNPGIIFDDTKDFVLSFTVIRELDKLKRNPDVKSAAQTAIKNIWAQFEIDKVEILNVPNLLGDSPDEKIIQDTKDANASILSNDIAVRIIAKAHSIDISSFDAGPDIDYEFTGYVTIDGDLTYEQEYASLKEIQLLEFNEIFKVDLKENQYCIIRRYMQEKFDIWVNRQNNVVRISQSMKPFRDVEVLIDPMDAIQMCALDAVTCDIPLVVIDGALGCLVAGESLDVDFDSVIVSDDVLYKHIQDNTNASTNIINFRLSELRKYNFISKENDLTEFGPSLLIYFKLDRSKTRVFNNDKKFENKYLHFRYWLSYFDFDIEKAYQRVSLIRRNKRFFNNDSNNYKEYKDISNIQSRLISGEQINFRCSGRFNIEYWILRGWSKEEAIDKITNIQSNISKNKDHRIIINGFSTTEAFSKDVL